MLQAVRRQLTELARISDDRSRDDASTSDAQASSSNNDEVIFREIHKNGWLRRTTDRDSSSRFWVAFCVHDDTDPRLEGFPDQKQAINHSPVWSQSLRNAVYLSPTLCATSKNDFEFCVNFNDDQILRLAAPTYQIMLDWVQIITRKLTDMKVLKPKENLYSRGPERTATRDPTSPLPPPPPSLTVPNSRNQTNSSTPSTSSAPAVFTFDDILTLSEDQRPMPTGRQPTRPAPPIPYSLRINPSTSTAGTSNSNNGTSNAHEDINYESVFLASSSYQPVENGRSDNAVASRSHSSSDEGEQYAALIEYRTSENPEQQQQHQPEQDLLQQPPPPPPAPPPPPPQQQQQPPTVTLLTGTASATVNSIQATSEQACSCNPRQPRLQLTLREQQVLQLRKEMSHPAGVRLKLGRRDCKDGIAFVDCFGAVWIAGWKHKEHPLLYNVLHIGDLVLSIAGIPLNGASSVKDILKNYTFPRVEMIVKRLPHGRVTTLTRRTELDDFGLEVGSSNEVVSISASAQQLGLSSITNPADPSADIGTTVSWTLTEVNNRPLNVFEGNARERLNALGRDVSVVLQPTDLVTGIKKKLRALRSYKSYVLQ